MAFLGHEACCYCGPFLPFALFGELSLVISTDSTGYLDS